jgi:hypothetical protein
MTILTAFDQASRLMGKGVQTSLVSSSDPFAVEMLALANEVAPQIAKRHDWQKLITLMTQAGDDVTTSFSLPDDYDRMPVKAKVFQNSTAQPMYHVTDLDVWLENRLQSFTGAVNEWIILGGQLQIFPAMASTESAKYYYVSNLIVDPAAGPNKTAFNIDSDVFVLPERLLTLGLVYSWLQMKRLDYAQDMEDFEMALAQEIARDKGSRVLHVGQPRMPGDVNLAYRGTISA